MDNQASGTSLPSQVIGPPSSVRSKSKSAKDTLDTWRTDMPWMSMEHCWSFWKNLFGVVKEHNNKINYEIINKLTISVELLETKQHGIYGIMEYIIAWCPRELIHDKVNKKTQHQSLPLTTALLQETMAMLSDKARATGVVCSIKLDLFFLFKRPRGWWR